MDALKVLVKTLILYIWSADSKKNDYSHYTGTSLLVFARLNTLLLFDLETVLKHINCSSHLLVFTSVYQKFTNYHLDSIKESF